MTSRKDIKSKLLFGIITPLVIIILCFGILITIFVGTKFSTLEWNTIEDKSLSASYQISDFFTKYTEIVNQMGENEAILQMMQDIKKPGDSLTVSSYDMAEACLNNIEGCDDNISLAWTVDLDSGDSVRSSGITRGLTIDDYDVTTRDWYIQAMDSKKLVITEPYIDTLSQTLVTSVIQPAYDSKGSMIGLVAVDMTLATLDTTMQSYTLGNNGKFFLVTENGTIMYHPDSEKITLNISEGDFSDSLVSAINNNALGKVSYKYGNTSYRGYISTVGNTGWRVISGLPNSEFYASTLLLIIQVILLIIISCGILVSIIIKVSNGIVNPVKKLAASADEIAEGHLDVEIDTTAEDETGLVAEALNRTVVRLKDYIAYIDEIAFTLDELTKGNLNLSLKQSYDGEFQKIKVSLETFVNTLQEVMSQINATAIQVAEGSKHVADGAQSLAEGTLSQSTSMETLAESINAMMEQLKNSSEHAGKASDIADEEAKYINQSKEKMAQLVEAIQEINSKSDEIGTIVQTIDGIASQTNMLSLNAAIEAARAGEAGKGFAVVATEVSNLAQKSTEASQSISMLIDDTLKAVSKGVTLATESESIQDIVVEKAKEANEYMRSIAERTSQEVSKSASVTGEISEITSVIQNTSATAEESSAASEELNNQAEVLKEMVSKFKFE